MMKESIKTYDQALKSALKLTRYPVGIKFFFTEEEYEASALEESNYKMSYCVYVEKASRTGLSLKTKLEHHYCDGGTTALGLEKPNARISTGREYYSYGLYKTPGIAQKVWNNVPLLSRMGVEAVGVGIAPLENFQDHPDIVILVGEATSMMKIIQGYLYQTGERLSLDVSGMQGMCSEVTVIPYVNNQINISLLCPSTRTLSKWKNNELAAGIPYSMLDMVIDGVKAVEGK